VTVALVSQCRMCYRLCLWCDCSWWDYDLQATDRAVRGEHSILSFCLRPWPLLPRHRHNIAVSPIQAGLPSDSRHPSPSCDCSPARSRAISPIDNIQRWTNKRALSVRSVRSLRSKFCGAEGFRKLLPIAVDCLRPSILGGLRFPAHRVLASDLSTETPRSVDGWSFVTKKEATSRGRCWTPVKQAPTSPTIPHSRLHSSQCKACLA